LNQKKGFLVILNRVCGKSLMGKGRSQESTHPLPLRGGEQEEKSG